MTFPTMSQLFAVLDRAEQADVEVMTPAGPGCRSPTITTQPPTQPTPLSCCASSCSTPPPRASPTSPRRTRAATRARCSRAPATSRPTRGRRASRQSPFTSIDRPDTHIATHKALPKQPSAADLDTWLAGARACAELRCPELPRKVDQLKTAQPRMLDQFLTPCGSGQALDPVLSFRLGSGSTPRQGPGAGFLI